MSLELLIEALHASPIRLSLCICGAGAGCIARLTQVPECSRTLLEASVLYHRASTRTALDGLPRHIVSVESAQRLAQHAFHQSKAIALAEARESVPAPEQSSGGMHYLFGIGATSAIKTSRVRRSSDQVFVSVWGGAVPPSTGRAPAGACHTQEVNNSTKDLSAGSTEAGAVYDYHMDLPDSFDRAEQDRQVELMVLHAIAETVARCRTTIDPSLVKVLLPSPPDVAAAAVPVRGGDRLCAVPSRSGPLPVPLNAAQEIAEAVDAVLSYTPTADSPADVCVLWNQHGELRRSGRPPYSPEDEELISSLQPQQPQELQPPGASTEQNRSAMRPLRLLYPGSFNPLHYGHTELVQAAARVLRRQQRSDSCDPPTPVQVTYEIAVQVVDKGAISSEDVQRRVVQFLARGERVAVTNAKLFISKAKLFPGHGFLIGMDTAVRVVDPQHYCDASTSANPAAAEAAMVAALQRDIGDRGCYFVVGGRKTSDATGWQDLSMLPIPPAIRHLFIGIPDTEFRVDISSTELRAKRRGHGAG